MFGFEYWEERRQLCFVTGNRSSACPVCLRGNKGPGPLGSVVICGACLLRVHTLCASLVARPMRWLCLSCQGSD